MADPTGVVAHLTGSFVDGLPRYLLTVWDYVVTRPRRFFLRYEQDPQRYIAPWPFLLINALVAAGLAVSVEPPTNLPEGAWDWTLYWTIVPAGFVAHILVLGCAALAAAFTRQRVTMSSMLTAFAYASVWVLVGVPALSALDGMAPENPWYTAVLCLTVGSELCHIAYLVGGFVHFNYLTGRKAVYFVLVTALLVVVGSIAVMLGIAYINGPFDEDSKPQLAINHDFLPTCHDATLNGHIITRAPRTIVWFEWGETPRLGITSAKQVLTEPAAFHVTLPDLHEQKTYFCRAVMSNQYGTRYSELTSFTTSTCKSSTRTGGVTSR